MMRKPIWILFFSLLFATASPIIRTITIHPSVTTTVQLRPIITLTTCTTYPSLVTTLGKTSVTTARVTVTEKETETQTTTETVMSTVPVKLGELEFPKTGYLGTITIHMTAVAMETIGSGMGKDMADSATTIYGSDGSVVGFLPAES
jgi:hypothetical protein